MSKTVINSELKTINAAAETVFEYINDFNNIKDLLPQDKISDWTSDVDQCSFKVQNAATIPLIKESVEKPNKINIKSGEKAPFPFTLVVHINSKDATSEAHMVFEGDINAFLKMMVVGPLTNLFNYMGEELKKRYEQ